jgi:hypothetical protein
MNSRTWFFISVSSVNSVILIAAMKKGDVEAMVKYIRNYFLLPSLHVIELDELNKELWAKAEKDPERKHIKRNGRLRSSSRRTRRPFSCCRQNNTNVSGTRPLKQINTDILN